MLGRHRLDGGWMTGVTGECRSALCCCGRPLWGCNSVVKCAAGCRQWCGASGSCPIVTLLPSLPHVHPGGSSCMAATGQDEHHGQVHLPVSTQTALAV